MHPASAIERCLLRRNPANPEELLDQIISLLGRLAVDCSEIEFGVLLARQPAADHFLATGFEGTAQRIGVRTRVQPRGANQILAAEQNSRALRAAHVFAAAERDHLNS